MYVWTHERRGRYVPTRRRCLLAAGAVALASAETVHRSGLHGHPAAIATGTGVLAISLTGSLIAAAALLALPRGAGRLPAPNFAMS